MKQVDVCVRKYCNFTHNSYSTSYNTSGTVTFAYNKLLKRTLNSWLALVPRNFSPLFLVCYLSVMCLNRSNILRDEL